MTGFVIAVVIIVVVYAGSLWIGKARGVFDKPDQPCTYQTDSGSYQADCPPGEPSGAP